jgi:hypothetical protein
VSNKTERPPFAVLNAPALRFCIVVLAFVGCWLWSSPASAQLTDFDADYKWHTLQTENFYIHYHEETEQLARRLAPLAEEVHDEVVVLLRWEPRIRTHVVVADSVDVASAYSTAVPWPRVQMFAARPDLHGSLADSDDQLKLTFKHEFTHVVARDMNYGLAWFFRSIFGRGKLLFPNALSPAWMREGVATTVESEDDTQGRMKATYTHMVMRTEVAFDRLKGVDVASLDPKEWPMTHVPFLYGVKFMEYLRETYGEGKMLRYLRENGDNAFPTSDHMYALPFLYNKDARDVWGKTFPTMWGEFKASLISEYGGEIARLRKAGLTEFEYLSDPSDMAGSPRFSSDGKTVYYTNDSQTDSSSLMKSDVESGEMESVATLREGRSLAVAPDDTVYVSDLSILDNHSLYYDVFKLSPRVSGVRRLTRRARVRELEIFPDGGRAVWITFDAGRYSLKTSTISFSEPRTLIGPTVIQLQYVRASHDGTRVAFTFKDLNGRVDVAVLNLINGEITRVTNDDAVTITPAWHPDDKRLLYVSDRDGVYNLYSHHLETGEVQRLTNVLTGVFFPDVSDDGDKIVMTEYRPRGVSVALTDYPEQPRERFQVDMGTISPGYFRGDWPESAEPGDAVIEKERRYSPWRSLAPSAWSVAIGSEELGPGQVTPRLGAQTNGRDALMHHSYELKATYGVFHGNLNLTGEYTNSQGWPEFTLRGVDEQIFLVDDPFPFANDSETYHDIYFRRTLSRGGTFEVTLPYRRYYFEQDVTFGFRYENRQVDEYFPDASVEGAPQDQGMRNLTQQFNPTLSSLRFRYRASSARRYEYSISPEDGRTWTVEANYYSPLLLSDEEYVEAMTRYSEYISGFWKNDVLMLRLKGGAAFEPPRYLAPFSLGRYFRGATESQTNAEDQWGIRGYPAQTVFGNFAAVATAEYRFPLIQQDWGLGTFPIMFRNMWITPFADFGQVTFDPDQMIEFPDYKLGAGAELHLEFRGGYIMDLDLYVGAARGFDEFGHDTYYLGLSVNETAPLPVTADRPIDETPNEGQSDEQWLE